MPRGSNPAFLGSAIKANNLSKQIADLQQIATVGKIGKISAPISKTTSARSEVTVAGNVGAYVYDVNNIPILLKTLPEAKATTAASAAASMKKAAEQMFWSRGRLAPNIPPAEWVNALSTAKRKKGSGAVPSRESVAKGSKGIARVPKINTASRPLFESGQLIGDLHTGLVKTDNGFLAAVGFSDSIHMGRRGGKNGEGRRSGERPTVAQLAAILEDGGGNVPAFRWMAKTADYAGPFILAAAAEELAGFVSSHNNIPVNPTPRIATGATDAQISRFLKRGF